METVVLYYSFNFFYDCVDACFETLDQCIGDCPNAVALLFLLTVSNYSSYCRCGCLLCDD